MSAPEACSLLASARNVASAPAVIVRRGHVGRGQPDGQPERLLAGRRSVEHGLQSGQRFGHVAVGRARERGRDREARVVGPARAGLLQEVGRLIAIAEAQVRVGDELVDLGQWIVADERGLPGADRLAGVAPGGVARAEIEHAWQEVRRGAHRGAELLRRPLRSSPRDRAPARAGTTPAATRPPREAPHLPVRRDAPRRSVTPARSQPARHASRPARSRARRRAAAGWRSSRTRIELADGVHELVLEHVIGRDAARHAELACALDGAAARGDHGARRVGPRRQQPERQRRFGHQPSTCRGLR